MLNQVTLIGRVVETPVVKKLESDNKATTLVLAVTRAFKNMNGNYDTDFIRISLWNGIAENAAEYLRKGDIVGIKGRISVRDTEVNFTTKDEILHKKLSILEVIGERVCFIHTNRKKGTEVVEEELWNKAMTFGHGFIIYSSRSLITLIIFWDIILINGTNVAIIVMINTNNPKYNGLRYVIVYSESFTLSKGSVMLDP